MGNCFRAQQSNVSEQRTSLSNRLHLGASNQSNNREISLSTKHVPLKPVRPKWKSDVPLTEGVLRSKRDEFWETAPAFDGRKEIWDALRAAAETLERGDYEMANVIIQSANIALPSGTLLDAYDELGNRYQLPVYVLSAPHNMVLENSSADASAGLTTLQGTTCNGNENISADEKCTQGLKHDMSVKLRVSTGTQLRLKVLSSETVLLAKQRLALTLPPGHDAHNQRWFFGGKAISDDVVLSDLKIPKHFVVQVIIRNPPTANAPSSPPVQPNDTQSLLSGLSNKDQDRLSNWSKANFCDGASRASDPASVAVESAVNTQPVDEISEPNASTTEQVTISVDEPVDNVQPPTPVDD